jgi:hypothetical protein
MTIGMKSMVSPPSLNVSTTPILATGCRQCLPLSVVQLKGKHCRKPHCHNGVVDTFGPSALLQQQRVLAQVDLIALCQSKITN